MYSYLNHVKKQLLTMSTDTGRLKRKKRFASQRNGRFSILVSTENAHTYHYYDSEG